MYQFIQHQTQLPPLLALMARSQCCYLDTEFIRMRTRYPILGLLQLNLDGHIFLIDPLTVDLTEVWNTLFDIQTLVLHSGNEDISLLFHYAQRTDLKQVFDTQIALFFLDYGQNMGYQASLEECLGIQIFKHEARSNWLARPLTQQQLSYASNDVFYLPELAEHLIEQLKHYGLYDYVLQDSYSLSREIATVTPIEQLYLNYARVSFSPRQLAQLKQLTEWRELLSIEKNIPPSFILKSNELVNLIHHQPKNEYQVSQLLGDSSHSKRYLGVILKLLYKLPPKREYPARIIPAYRPSAEARQAIDELIEQTANDLDIACDVLMRKKWMMDLQEIVTSGKPLDTLPDFLLRWRYAIITQPILQILYDDKNASQL